MAWLLAWLVPLVLGWLLLRCLLTAHERARAGVVLLLASAVPLGVGLTSVLAFAAALMFGLSTCVLAASEVSAGVVLWLVARGRHDGASWTAIPVPARAPWWLRLCVGAGLLGALLSFLAQARAWPLGDADGIAIWGNRAVFLQRAWGNWALVFSPELVHTDYPLLVPVSLLRAFVYAGGEPPLAGVALAFVFAACTYAALGAAMARLRGGAFGGMAVLALCATPFFAVQAAGQTADVPVSCYALLAAVWLRVTDGRALALVGAFLGCAAWTKNEGALLALVFTAVVVVSRTRQRGAWRALRGLLAGMAPALLVLAVFSCGWPRATTCSRTTTPRTCCRW